MKTCIFCKCKFVPISHINQVKFCSRSCAISFSNSNRKLSAETKNKIGDKMKRYYAHHSNPRKQKFLPREKRNCLTCKIEFLVLPKSTRQFCSRKCCNVGLKILLVGKTGGFRQTSGRGKQGKYKNFYYNSSWELAWIIYNLDHNIPFIRNTTGFEYSFEGKLHKFYPDFIVNSNEFVEVKGYNSKQFDAKKRQFPHKLTILRKNEILPYIQYVSDKYGKNILKK